jgi:uncharacterized protein YjiS (DUF1127 family)
MTAITINSTPISFDAPILPLLIWFEIVRRLRAIRSVSALKHLDEENLQDIGVERYELLQLVRPVAPCEIPNLLQSSWAIRSGALCRWAQPSSIFCNGKHHNPSE